MIKLSCHTNSIINYYSSYAPSILSPQRAYGGNRLGWSIRQGTERRMYSQTAVVVVEKVWIAKWQYLMHGLGGF